MLYIGGYILNSACFLADIQCGAALFSWTSEPPFREVTMKHIDKQRKHRFLKAELAVLVCLVCFWVFKSGTVDIADVTAGVLRQVVKIDPDNTHQTHTQALPLDTSLDEVERNFRKDVNCQRQITPESIAEDNYQRSVANIDQRYRSQWDEVNRRRSALGPRRHAEMLCDIQARSRAEFDKLYQAAQNQAEEFKLIDQLAQQKGFDPYEAKMRIVLGPEAEAAMFPEEKTDALSD